ncbi:MAG: hypothetical protein ACI841_003337 [Planctomycetota bacterium]|jgi:hypothetical protein
MGEPPVLRNWPAKPGVLRAAHREIFGHPFEQILHAANAHRDYRCALTITSGAHESMEPTSEAWKLRASLVARMNKR